MKYKTLNTKCKTSNLKCKNCIALISNSAFSLRFNHTTLRKITQIKTRQHIYKNPYYIKRDNTRTYSIYHPPMKKIAENELVNDPSGKHATSPTGPTPLRNFANFMLTRPPFNGGRISAKYFRILLKSRAALSAFPPRVLCAEYL